MAAEAAKDLRLALVGQAFRPSAPIDDLELFAGRAAQRADVITAVTQKGSHVGLYGERGVGKTSLAKVLAAIFSNPRLPSYQAAMVNCHTEDDFDSVWRNVFRDLDVECDDMSPEGVRRTLERLDTPAIVVIDELDRLDDDMTLTLLADTIKTLSDHTVASTLVLVGVASSIGELIGEHESIVRNISQIKMPRMSPDELREILSRGCDHAGLRIRHEASERIVRLSEGLPHYTHLLGLKSAEHVVQDDREEVTLADVEACIPRAVQRHTVENDYLSAIRSSQPGNLYREVFVACALAPKDRLGYFKSRDVRDALEVVTGRRIEIPQFAQHMKEFMDPARGSILYREGKPRAYSYRFRDAMMQPYIILMALKDGLITADQLDVTQGMRPTTVPEPSEPEQLF